MGKTKGISLVAWQGEYHFLIQIQADSEIPEGVLEKKPSSPHPVFVVHFFGSRDYAWFTSDVMKPLQPHWKELSAKNKTELFKRALKETENPECLLIPLPPKKTRQPKEVSSDSEKVVKRQPSKRRRASEPEGSEEVSVNHLI